MHSTIAHSPSVPPFRPPWWLRNGHAQTVWTTLFRPVPDVRYVPETIELADGDILELAWSFGGEGRHRVEERPSRRLVVLSHGLEGSVERRYMRGMAQRFNAAGWDALAWNMRGCGERPNRLPRPYHSGATMDLDAVVRRGLDVGGYEEIVLVGFSLGANLTLLYLGREHARVPRQVAGAVAICAPVDLLAAARELERPANWLYEQRFLQSLRGRARALLERHPGAFDPAALQGTDTLFAYDDAITAPLVGFDGALDYYTQSSSLPHLPAIDRPTLILSAADDPFLPAACYPHEVAAQLPYVTLESPPHGGHCGFRAAGDGRRGTGRDGGYWSERQALAFAEAAVGGE